MFRRGWLSIIAGLCVFGVYADADTSAKVIVELQDAPAAKAYVDAIRQKAEPVRAAQKQLARIESAQQALLDTLDAKSGAVQPLFRVQRIFNGIALRVDSGQLAQLSALPGVRAVHRLHSVQLHNSTSVPFIGANTLWNYPGLALTGKNISVGIVDTGIDYVHPDFGGSGANDVYQANDPTVLGDIPFPTAKVVGGYDFCGDDYDSTDIFNDTPFPDPDPMDANGHGTHVAGTVAGFGVTSSNATYIGSYSETTPVATMKIGPGVAPEASLYALKIFGASGDSDLLLPAIEWAVDPNADGDFSDHLDVLNMSLGEAFGPADAPEAIACGNAAAVGVIIVASAGNSWDTYFSAGMPAAAPAVISVAACEDQDPSYPELSPDKIAYFSSRGPSGSGDGSFFLKPDITAPGRAIRSAAAKAVNLSTLYRDMSGTSMAAPHIAGTMALLRQSRPEWSIAELKALLMNNAADVFSASNYGLPKSAPARAGAGRAQVNLLAEKSVVAFDADAPEAVSVTFQTREAAGNETENRTIRVLNKGTSPVNYNAALDILTDIPGITISLDPASTGSIAPGTYADLTLHLQADAAAMQHSRDPAAKTNFSGNERYWISEVSGFVQLTPAQKDNTLRVPFYGAVRPVSDMHAGIDLLDVQTTPSLNVPLEGQSLITPGPFPLAEESLLSAFELLCYSPDDASSTGLQNAADILYIGAASDYADCLAAGLSFEDTTVYIALVTQNNWFSLHWPVFNIYLDTDKDGLSEFRLRSFHQQASETEGGRYPDVFTARLYDFASLDRDGGFINYYAAGERNTVPFMTNIMVLPLRVRDIGLTSEDSSFAFRIESLSIEDDSLAIDQAPTELIPGIRTRILYDPAHPGLDFRDNTPGPPMFPDLDGNTFPVYFDDQGYYPAGILECEDETADYCSPVGPLGLLLLHHHNRTGDKAEWIPVMTPGDTDGDTLPDAVEGTADPDGDGFPNLVDRDADNDGIPDAVEGAGDPDLDGIPNYLDLDSDDDTLPDAQEPMGDFDHDGKPNFLDTDSDDDTLSDADEANIYHTSPYLADTDNDGIPDNAEGFDDPDHDGLINPIDPDSDGDKIGDVIEGTNDADNDTIPNYLDLDSDGDGIPDLIESYWDTDNDKIYNFLDLDSDDDGIPDEVEGTVDTDSDLKPNYIDLDSDADGIPDKTEGVDDPDNDTLPNYIDPDSDGDGINDVYEGQENPDNDALPNYLDLDSDDDSWPDSLEAQYGTDPYSNDSDGDGIPDPEDGAENPDNDLYINALDDDSDGDGIPDIVEGSGDPDNDTLPNYLDADSDDDGIPDAEEGMEDPDDDSLYNAIDDDSDGDGILDIEEGVGDPDTDTIPNYLDPDSDNDSLPDLAEGLGDPDNDTIPNYLDDDSDGDGLDDLHEATVSFTNPYLPDTDEDGRPDGQDANPSTADPPDAPANLIASDGAFTDHVEVTWTLVPGSAEYQVFRREKDSSGNTTALGTWQRETVYNDFEALATREIPGHGCQGPKIVQIIYEYGVQARIAPSNAEPTAPSPNSPLDEGYREP